GSWTDGVVDAACLLSAASRPARASAMAEVVSSYRCGAAPELGRLHGPHRTSLLIHRFIAMKRWNLGGRNDRPSGAGGQSGRGDRARQGGAGWRPVPRRHGTRPYLLQPPI